MMSEKKKKLFRLLKWIVVVFFLMALTLFAASRYLMHKLEPYVRQEITTFVQKSTHHLYAVGFSNIQFNLLTGSATINDVKIYPDTQVYHQLITAKKAPNNLYYISLKQLAVKHFHPLAMYFNKEAKVDLLLFDKPEVRMVNRHFPFNEGRLPHPEKSPYDYISRLFKSLRIAKIDFRNANFKYVNNNGPVPEVDSVANLHVTLSDWLIDEQVATDTTRMYLLKNIQVALDDYQFATPDSLYFLRAEQLDFELQKGKLHVKQFSLIPRYSAYQLGEKSGYSADRFSVKLNNVILSGIDLPAYIQKQDFLAKRMDIADGEVRVQNDNRFPKRNVLRKGKFPHQLLQALRLKLKIDLINLHNIDVSYEEFDRDSRQTGKISFEKTKGSITGVTNMPGDRLMMADLTSYVMGQGLLRVHFDFDRMSPVGAFGYRGKLTNLDGKTFNQITKPLGMVQVNRGEIKELSFDIKANEQLATGDLAFRYENLSVALMKKEAGKDRLVRQGLISFLANKLVLYSDNPNAEGKFTEAKIRYEREPEASFFNFIWKTLFQGVKYSVGVTPRREAEIKAQIAVFERLKADRELRRQRKNMKKEQKN